MQTALELLALFPAWAGVIPPSREYAQRAATIPRMGGGDPSNPTCYKPLKDYSPHGRG